MAQVIVRNLEEAVVQVLKHRARASGHSLEQELREILTAAASPTREELLARVDRIREQVQPGVAVDVERLVRPDDR